MKLYKLFLMVVCAFCIAACSDDDESWNTNGNVSVSMGQSTLSIKENRASANPLTLPIKVTGARNGMIQVTVGVEEVSENPAKEDQHYYITSKTINILPEDSIGNLELMTVDNAEINDPRQFNIVIVEAKGATIDESSKVLAVTLRDNDADFYDKLGGKWQMTYEDPNTGETGTWDVVLNTYDEDTPYYNKFIEVTGMMGYPWTTAYLEYNYDKEEGVVTLDLLYNELFAEEVNFGLGGYNDVLLMGLDVDADAWTDESPVGLLDTDTFNTIEFDSKERGIITYGLIFSGTEYTGYYWFKDYINSLTR